MSETNSDSIKKRHIRSYVRHLGRLTLGQQQALTDDWPDYGIDIQTDKIDFTQFGDFKKTVLELGFGNGESLIKMAQNAPDTLFIGIEVHRPGIGHAIIAAKENSLKNIRVMEGDAVVIIDQMFSDNQFDRVQIYFPDPWHKKRHFKRRLIQTEFCQKLHRILKTDARLHIATDWSDYAKHCLKVIQPLDYLENISTDYTPKPDYRPTTKFERRGIRLGHEIKDMIFANKK